MREERLTLVHDICGLIAHASDHNLALQRIVQHIAVELNAQVCLISLLDPTSSQLEIQAAFGFRMNEKPAAAPILNILELACKRAKTINTPLQVVFPVCDSPLAGQASRVNSLMVVPLMASGKAIGTLAVGRRSKQVFPARMVTLCEALAAPLAAFIQNASLTRQISENGSSADSDDSGEDRTASGAEGLAAAVFRGRSIVSGVTWGHAMLLAPSDSLNILNLEKSADPAREQELLEKAIAAARQGIRKITLESVDVLAETDISIFDMYLMLLDDPVLQEHLQKYLQEGYTLNSALSLTYKKFSDEYQNFTDEYLRERLYDVKDVLLRIKNAAANIIRNGGTVHDGNGENVHHTDKRIILVAQELLPTQLIASPLKHVCGIICESGGPTSHAAILAKALHIPMLISDKGTQSRISSGNTLLLDCQSGLCYLKPTAALLRQYRQPLALFRRLKQAAASENTEQEPADVPQTLDGVTVHLAGNITLFSELANLHNAGVREVGLYRTEFMFMIRNAMPDEEEQFRVISRLVSAAKGDPVTIRALDIGGDKPLPYINWEHEDNPSLGWRGLRFLLSNPEFLHTHLRAILRTSALGPVSIMFPMVGDLYDLLQAKEALEKAQSSLREDGIAFDGKHQFGIMLEVPSAVVALDQLLPKVDFISIGTNDLIQYLFAVDRGNSRVNRWYRQSHPIVLRTLQYICQKTAQFPGKRVSLCGELAGQARALPLLLGAGLRRLSMNSNFIPAVRSCIEKVSIIECNELFAEASQMSSELDVQKLLDDFYRRKEIDLMSLS
ncbi:MAG: phosphoenolpyruvate--protein phosphotransferase [Lentisphaerae bacterium]|jgi:phosphoenolpyruvate-protein phosphotransferase|nr:phosphoenolpyruvate--protein phosphotransferase [Lentisphaerota bacterium]